ncbi:MAG: CoA-binding protein [Candidatus Helarchaeota archaeon]|nr:CoA-binding protein [Candidatus Helarchaeota archaeon]
MSQVVEQIDGLFHTRSIAVFGASAKGGRQGNLLLQGFIDIGFDGELIPIHPNATEVMGLKAYPNLKEYGKPVDLAVLSIHPAKVFDAVRDCVENGKARGIIIFSAGFREQGSEGKNLEEEIARYATARGTRIIGPNCMGLYAPSTKLSFFPGLPTEQGIVAFISQSGSLAVHLNFMAALKGIYFSKMISCGNSVDLDLSDFLEYLGADPETKVITCYIEGIKDGNRFIQVAKEVSKQKPIIVWKVGDTPGGQRAAQSHTGAISGDAEIWERVFDQAGIIRVNNLNEMIGHIGAFLHPFLPKGNRVAIISGPGGPAVSSADACEKAGLQLASIAPKIKQEMAEVLPEFGTSVRNPIDLSLAVAFDPTINSKAVAIVGKDENVDSLLMYVSTLQKSVLKGVLKAQEQIRKPIALVTSIDPTCSFQGAESIRTLFNPIRPKRVVKTLQELNENGISVHLTEQDAAKALVALWKYQQYLYQNPN